MKKTALLLLLLLIIPGALFAHTGGMVDFICPIDQTEFSAYQDFSGTSFGVRLDFKKIGPIAQPWTLPDCPKCHFVLFDEEASQEDLDKLRPFILSEAYQEHAKKSSYYRLALIKTYLHKPLFHIAWMYLQASWQNEDNSAAYQDCLTKALDTLRKALPQVAKMPEQHDDYLVACYLRIELARRLGDFTEANTALREFPPIGTTEITWLPQVLAFEKERVAAKDSGSYSFEDALPKK